MLQPIGIKEQILKYHNLSLARLLDLEETEIRGMRLKEKFLLRFPDWQC